MKFEKWDGVQRLDEWDRRLGVPFKAFMVACVGRMRGKKGKRHDLAQWWERAGEGKRNVLRKALEAVELPLKIEEIIG